MPLFPSGRGQGERRLLSMTPIEARRFLPLPSGERVGVRGGCSP
jgi:hypothetical protein